MKHYITINKKKKKKKKKKNNKKQKTKQKKKKKKKMKIPPWKGQQWIIRWKGCGQGEGVG